MPRSGEGDGRWKLNQISTIMMAALPLVMHEENAGQNPFHMLWHAVKKGLRRGPARKIAENAHENHLNNVANNQLLVALDVDLAAGCGKLPGGKTPENTYQAYVNTMADGKPCMVLTKMPNEVKNKKNLALALTGFCFAVLIAALGIKMLGKGNSVFMWLAVGSSDIGLVLGLYAIFAWECLTNPGVANLELAAHLNYIIAVFLVHKF